MPMTIPDDLLNDAGLTEQEARIEVACRLYDAGELRELAVMQWGDLVMAACRSASEIYRSRLAAGMAVEQPAPWPASTWEFSRTQAQNARRTFR